MAEERDDERLKRVCAWCGKHLGGPKDAPPDRVSHGICKDCMKKELAEAEKRRK